MSPDHPTAAGTIAITGSSGYLGRRFSDAIAARGYRVLRMSRSGDVRFCLGLAASSDFFVDEHVDVLVHCAYDFSVSSAPDITRINVNGSKYLLEAAVKAGVPRVITISSMSAYPGTRSRYGTAKLAIEGATFEAGGIVIRPGLAWEDTGGGGGLFGALSKVVQRSPIVPLIAGDRRQYLVNTDDLCQAVADIVEVGVGDVDRPIVAASQVVRTFREVLSFVAQRANHDVTFVPVPAGAVQAGLRATEAIGLHLPFRSDSITSLLYTDPAPDFTAAEHLGLRFRDIPFD